MSQENRTRVKSGQTFYCPLWSCWVVVQRWRPLRPLCDWREKKNEHPFPAHTVTKLGWGGPGAQSGATFSQSDDRSHCCQPTQKRTAPPTFLNCSHIPSLGTPPPIQAQKAYCPCTSLYLAGLHSHLWKWDTARNPPTRKTFKALCPGIWKVRSRGRDRLGSQQASPSPWLTCCPVVAPLPSRGSRHAWNKEKARLCETVMKGEKSGCLEPQFPNFWISPTKNFPPPSNLEDFSTNSTETIGHPQAKTKFQSIPYTIHKK